MGTLKLRAMPGGSVGPAAGWTRAVDISEFSNIIAFQSQFNYIGDFDQSIAVPYTETGLIFEVWGAGSGTDPTYSGRGAYAKLLVSGIPGEVFALRVPSAATTMGSSGLGGVPGGGNGLQALTQWAEGGGGYAMILKAPFNFPADIIAIVPGGGGKSRASAGDGRGGDGDMNIGDPGQYVSWNGSIPPEPGGGGGTQSAGGVAGGNGAGGSTAGAARQGGNGGSSRTIGLGGAGGGGGGGGYFGGGGGGTTAAISWYGAGGGGGSGWYDPSKVTLLTSTKGARLGDGLIICTSRRPTWPVPLNAVTFNYTGAQQTWVVPAGVTSIVVYLRGAQGAGNDGGKGLYIRFRMNVTPGETLYIYVGGQGASFNGGGASRWTPGGGATDIRQGGNAVANRVGVAGGGGGRGTGNGTVPGGDAGLLTARGAGTAWNVSFGSRSTWSVNGSSYGTAAVNEVGGGGGQSGYSPAYDGGGGGGGHKGGGGGQATGSGNTSGGGGGGTSWYDNTKATEIEFVEGQNVGNGSCIIRW